jgi:hypothetical protein
MAGAPHEVLILALRDRPDLLGELIHRVTGAPRGGPLEVVDAATRFAKSIEVRPDLIFRGESPRWILFELQNRPDEKKRRSWPLAVSLLCIREKAMGEVVVLTASRRVADWARRVGHQRGELGTRFELTPIVIHLAGKRIDALLDPARPELALFAAWAMHDRQGPEARRVVTRAVELVDLLPAPLRDAQERAILGVLSEPLLALLEKLSMDIDKIPETPMSRRVRLLFEKNGKAAGKREALLTVLEARGLTVTTRERARIMACKDAEVLDSWIAAGVTAESVPEVIGEAPIVKPSRPRKAAPKRASRRRVAAS